MSLAVPVGPAAVTAEWLTQALRGAGTIDRAAVQSVDVEPVGVGQGFTGQVVRLRLTYAGDAAGAPASLIAKLPAAAPDVRAALRPYNEREVRFYETVAPHAPLRTPRCHLAALDAAAGTSVLLLEDLDGRVGDNLAGCSLAEATLAVRHLARFHAAWWESPRLQHLDWLPAYGAAPGLAQASYRRSWAPFLAKIGALVPLPASLRELGKRFYAHGAHIRRLLAGPPHTIVHGDYRLDNMIFGGPRSEAPLAVLDWQTALRGRGVADIAYFLGYCLPARRRRAWGHDLLAAYHAALVDGGVRGYPPEQCAHDFRLSVFLLLTRLVLAGAVLDFTGERGRALAAALVQRTVAMLEDHHAGELLPG